MLLELKVKDLGIIEDLDWKLETGLNVITGETGAGKSLIIDAVELLLTGGGAEDIIRSGANQAGIEGVFSLAGAGPAVTDFLAANALDAADETLIVNCLVRRQKPTVVRVNGQAVTKTLLRQLGRLLIDIHGQSEHLSLLDTHSHLTFLDAYARAGDLPKTIAARLAELNRLKAELAALINGEKDALRQAEFLKYQVDEIKTAALQPGEDEELEKERHIIGHSEKLKEYSDQVYQALAESDSPRDADAPLARLNFALQTLKKLTDLDPALSPQKEALEKSLYTVQEIGREVLHYSQNLDFDPRRLEEIEIRLELVRSLKRKYGPTVPAVLAYLEKAEQDLNKVTNSSERRLQLERQETELKQSLGRLAAELSQKRQAAAIRLMESAKQALAELDMSQMQFAVSLARTESAEGMPVEGKSYLIGPDGIDAVEFLVSTNPGEPLKPLARIASTGEISRFTLALKGVLAQADQVPVLIFDEIDIGVGGRSGDIIGKKLWALARAHQVICVTHLPQIAAYADAHYYVCKNISGERTTSTLERLGVDRRLKELAAMLAGAAYSAAALKNAADLLHRASSFKNPRPASPAPAADALNAKPTQLSF